jgi:hypothetical protein
MLRCGALFRDKRGQEVRWPLVGVKLFAHFGAARPLIEVGCVLRRRREWCCDYGQN